MFGVHNIAAAHDNECFERWHELTCRNYSITEYRRPVTGPFRGRIAARRFGALTVSDVYSSFSDCGVEVVRGSGEIRKDPRDHFMLYLVCSGSVGIDQDGRTAHVGAGGLFVYDQSRPFTLEFGGNSSGIVLTIPRPLMVSRLPTAHRLTAHCIDGSAGLGALTAGIVRQIGECGRGGCQPRQCFRARYSRNHARSGGRGRNRRHLWAPARPGEAICSCQSRRCRDDDREHRGRAQPCAAHATSPVLGRGYDTHTLALAAAAHRKLQSARRRPRSAGDRRRLQFWFHRHFPFQQSIQKEIWLLAAHFGAALAKVHEAPLQTRKLQS
jgi:hypothetical protein